MTVRFCSFAIGVIKRWQTQEIGIRIALGATQSHVQLDVISRILQLGLIGIAIGVVASFLVARLIASLSFRTAPTDPLTFAGMAVLLGTVDWLPGTCRHEKHQRLIQSSRSEPIDLHACGDLQILDRMSVLSNYAQTATSSEMADSLFEIDSMRDLGCWQQSHRVYLDALTEGGTPPIAVP